MRTILKLWKRTDISRRGNIGKIVSRARRYEMAMPMDI
jgi:hypothetical protein